MRYQRIEQLIKDQFSSIDKLEIVDESHMHAGRQGQESHFKVLLVSKDFHGQSRVQRQRLINALCASEFSDGLHALSMRLLTPEEFSGQQGDFKSPDCRGGEKN